MSVEKLIEAMDDYREAKDKLAEMRSEYTGYSEGYHLASWFEAADRAKDNIKTVLDTYVDERIREILDRRGL